MCLKFQLTRTSTRCDRGDCDMLCIDPHLRSYDPHAQIFLGKLGRFFRQRDDLDVVVRDLIKQLLNFIWRLPQFAKREVR